MKYTAITLSIFMVLAFAGRTQAQHRVRSLPQASEGLGFGSVMQPPSSGEAVGVADFKDSTYGGRVRQIVTKGVSHNIYSFRNPFNADDSYLIGIQSNNQQKNWWVALYTGDGRFLKRLFPTTLYDWRLVWDRHDPDVLYTLGGANLYRYHVASRQADLLKAFAPLALKPNGPSLNQAGDRILVVTSDGTYRSYHLPDMSDERAFRAAYPAGCETPWKDERYTGYRNYIGSACVSPDYRIQAILIYNDDGRLKHIFSGVGGGGHFDFSPAGQLAYFTFWSAGSPLNIHVVNIDGSNDHVVLHASPEETRYIQNLHLSWPDKIPNWFIASFFPSAMNMPDRYRPLLDEIVRIGTDGSHQFLARDGTREGRRRTEFWAQPLASPSADGSRLSFNSNRSGQIQQYVLWISGS